MPNLEVRTMTREELDSTAIEWAAREGWNPGLSDAAAFFAADPGGFFIGLLDGEPVATLSAVAFGPAFGFIGLYIVRPDQRGMGHGHAIWKRGMEYLEGRNLGLDAVPQQQGSYRQAGFQMAHSNFRFQGCGPAPWPAGPDVRPIEPEDIESVVEFDAAYFPAPRRSFTRAWLAMPGCHRRISVSGGRVDGYGVLRPCRTGWKIGPLFARTPAVARRLFSELAGCTAGQPYFLDVPQANPAAMDLARDARMTTMFETGRMYTHGNPLPDCRGIFGITSFELG